MHQLWRRPLEFLESVARHHDIEPPQPWGLTRHERKKILMGLLKNSGYYFKNEYTGKWRTY